jgi:hypothetical protein
MVPGPKKIASFKELDIVEVDGAGNGLTYSEKGQVEDLPQVVEGSVLGGPTFNFNNALNKQSTLLLVCHRAIAMILRDII